ncbi:MAG: DoxX family protein [Gemmatimonadetes bacterium]|nr:DoxX family protein [Gemmatimonadota bacterium]
MSTNIATLNAESPSTALGNGGAGLARYLVPIGRAAFAAIFIVAAAGHFSQQTIAYAAQQGLPLPQILVPLSGLIAFAGGLSVLLGYRARIGAGLLVGFLVPATPMFHNFWAVTDPMMAQMQQAMFLKNLSMVGGALLIAYHGAGPLSLDARRAGTQAAIT